MTGPEEQKTHSCHVFTDTMDRKIKKVAQHTTHRANAHEMDWIQLTTLYVYVSEGETR